jgi:hypothetical protein
MLLLLLLLLLRVRGRDLNVDTKPTLTPWELFDSVFGDGCWTEAIANLNI